jgi:hypothetical protein
MRDHPAIRAVAHETSARVVWYDTAPCDGWFSRDVVYGETTRFDLIGPGGRKIALTTQLLGAHNVENIVGVAAFLLERELVSEAAHLSVGGRATIDLGDQRLRGRIANVEEPGLDGDFRRRFSEVAEGHHVGVGGRISPSEIAQFGRLRRRLRRIKTGADQFENAAELQVIAHDLRKQGGMILGLICARSEVGYGNARRRSEMPTVMDANTLPFEPSLDRAFATSDELRLYCDIWRQDATKPLTTKVELLDMTGQVLTTMDGQSPGGLATEPLPHIDVTFALANLTPGAYRLRVTATSDKGVDAKELGIAVK